MTRLTSRAAAERVQLERQERAVSASEPNSCTAMVRRLDESPDFRLDICDEAMLNATKA